MKNIHVFYDLDRPNSYPSTPIFSTEKPNGVQLSHRNKVKRRAEFMQLMVDLAPKPFTPEESTTEKDRILAMLDKLDFVARLRDIFDAIIKNQLVPKELIEAGKETAKSEYQILAETLAQSERMTIEDQKAIVFALCGGVENLQQVIRLLPQTVIEMPTQAGGVKKISGNTILGLIPKNIRQLIQ